MQECWARESCNHVSQNHEDITDNCTIKKWKCFQLMKANLFFDLLMCTQLGDEEMISQSSCRKVLVSKVYQHFEYSLYSIYSCDGCFYPKPLTVETGFSPSSWFLCDDLFDVGFSSGLSSKMMILISQILSSKTHFFLFHTDAGHVIQMHQCIHCFQHWYRNVIAPSELMTLLEDTSYVFDGE